MARPYDSGEFRDPVIWTIIAVVSSGTGQILGCFVLDQDLVRHDAAEQELASTYPAAPGILCG